MSLIFDISCNIIIWKNINYLWQLLLKRLWLARVSNSPRPRLVEKNTWTAASLHTFKDTNIHKYTTAASLHTFQDTNIHKYTSEERFLDKYHVPMNQYLLFVCLLFIVFNATFNNISAILWRSVLLVEEIVVSYDQDHESPFNIYKIHILITYKITNLTLLENQKLQTNWEHKASKD